MSNSKETEREKFSKWLSRKNYKVEDYPKTLVNKLFKLYQMNSRSEILNYLTFHNRNVTKKLKIIALNDVTTGVELVSKTDAVKRYTKEFIDGVISLGLTFDSPYKRNTTITMFFQGVLETLWVDGGYVKVENVKAKESARKAVETKTAKLIADIDRLKIKIPILERKVLEKTAVGSHFFLCLERGYDMGDVSNEKFLNRITVNYLRHRLTDYEFRIDQTFKKVGKQQAIRLLRTKIYRQIAIVYPFLKEECLNQMERRYENGGELFLNSLD